MKLVMKFLIVATFFTSVSGYAQGATDAHAAVDRFRSALKAGDTGIIEEVVADNVIIFEGSRVEQSLEEYSAHHLKSDIKFMQAVSSKLIERTVQEVDGLAVISSRYKVSGSYQGRKIDLTMNETVTLSDKAGLGWQITRIHWSN